MTPRHLPSLAAAGCVGAASAVSLTVTNQLRAEAAA